MLHLQSQRTPYVLGQMNQPMENISSLKDLLPRIDRQKAQIDALRPLTSEQEGRIMQKFRLDWNYHSNAIEGNSLTYGETIAFLMEGLTAKGKPLKDHLDIRGHDEAIGFLLYFIQNHQALSEKVIRELHEMILVESYCNPAQTPDGQMVEKRVTLGKYKSMPNQVKTRTGEIHYYASVEETPAKMTDLMDWWRAEKAKNDLHPLVLAATFHYQFVAIHPFDDGNRRMSRLLMNLILMQSGYPPVVIKQSDKQAYFYALRQADAGELDDFILYIGHNLLHSLEIQRKGANNESLEEPDDLDKQIALLKRRLESDDVLPNSDDVIRELLANTVLPLLQEIQGQCRKLDELFFRSEDRLLQDGERDSFTEWETSDWADLNRVLFLPHVGMPSKIRYDYQWFEFRKTPAPFSISRSISIEFEKFQYIIKGDGLTSDITLQKSYREKISPSEFTVWSKIFVQEALGQINERMDK